MYRPLPPQERSRLRFRRRRMRKQKHRPPLRDLVVRTPTQEELRDTALDLLCRWSRPNRNLVKTVRWIYGGPAAVKSLPENVRRNLMPAAAALCDKVELQMLESFRRDSISCRRRLRRKRVLSGYKNYRWTRFPAVRLDNHGRPAGLPARVTNPLFGAGAVHPKIVGFGHVADSPECVAMLRRIVGLEGVRTASELEEIAALPVPRRGEAGFGLFRIFLPALPALRRGFVWPAQLPAARRRFVLPPAAAGPPGVILFPREDEKEVLLCLPGGGLRVAALRSLSPRPLLRAG